MINFPFKLKVIFKLLEALASQTEFVPWSFLSPEKEVLNLFPSVIELD